MSMDHKAYVFDDAGFDQLLKPLLEAALVSGSTSGLRGFMLDHRDRITDPIEGEPLPDDWETVLVFDDVHAYGEYALTMFYDPQDDFGLATDWAAVHDVLTQHAPAVANAVLGRPLGPVDNRFDPGRMGSYFQSAAGVREALNRLRILVRQHPELGPKVDGFGVMLQRAVDAERGLYVTF